MLTRDASQLVRPETHFSQRVTSATVGLAVRAYWDGEGRFFPGKVTSVAPETPNICDITFEDGDAWRGVDLAAEVSHTAAVRRVRGAHAALQQHVQDAALFEAAYISHLIASHADWTARCAAAARTATTPPPRWPFCWVLENLANMPGEWKDVFSRFLADTLHQPYDSYTLLEVAHRLRTFWLFPLHDLQAHTMPPELLEALNLADAVLHLRAAFQPTASATGGVTEVEMPSITTARASVQQLLDWNRNRRHLTDDDRREMRARAVVLDSVTGEYRNVTRACPRLPTPPCRANSKRPIYSWHAGEEACLAMGLPGDYLTGFSADGPAARAVGSAFNAAAIAHAQSAHFAELTSRFESINVVDLFSGIGTGSYVAVLAHEAGIINLNALFSVEVDDARSDAFARWLASRPSGKSIRHVRVRDITKLEDASFQAILHDIGGGHLILGGSPCNNLSGTRRVCVPLGEAAMADTPPRVGRNQTAGPAGRSGPEGPVSCLYHDFVRLLHAAAGVPLRVARAA